MPIKENVGFVERIHKASQEELSLDDLTSAVVDQVNAVLSTPEGKTRMAEFKTGMDDEIREVYGDRYEELRYHEAKDPEVSELLVRHAIKTGKWRELPKELHSMYHEMAGDIGCFLGY